MGMLMMWPAIGCDIRMFHIRPIDPTGGRTRKNTWNEMGCDAHTHTANCHAPDLDFEFNRKKVD